MQGNLENAKMLSGEITESDKNDGIGRVSVEMEVLKRKSSNPVKKDVPRNSVSPSTYEPTNRVVEEENIKMKKQVGLPSGVSFIVGIMIGSGIFISPKGVLAGTGSVAASLLVWTGCGVIAISGALCFTELGTMIPKSGGEFAYLKESLGPIPAFFSVWTGFVISRTSSQAIISLSFAQYVLTPFFDACGPPQIALKILATATVITVCLVNCYSAEVAARVQVIFTVVKTLALVVVIVGGIISLAQGNLEHISTGFEGTVTSPSIIALAFYNGLWAYDGWNSLNYLTEELINPSVNLPRSIYLGVPLVMVIYLLTNISYLSVLSKTELLASPAVAVAWGEKILGSASAAIPIAVAFSTFGALNGSCFTGGRLCFVAAREGLFPGVLSYLNVHTLTPWTSLLFSATVGLAMIIPGDIGSLINFVSFTTWLIYGTTFLGLIVMRFTHKDWNRPYKVPILIPVFMILVSVYLIVAPIVEDPRIEFLYAALLVFDSVVMWLQLFLQVAPSKYEPES